MQLINTVPRLKARPIDAHKGTFGKALIVAGSFGMSGAAALAAKAALRSGSGLVRVALAKSILPIVAGLEPCCTTIPLPEDSGGVISQSAVSTVLDNLPDNDVVGIGPGLRVGRGPSALVESLIAQPGLKLVVDADGLNNLARLGDFAASLKANVILTPHPGEARRLWQSLFRTEMPDARQELALKLAARSKTTVVLKGAGTIVTDGDRLYVNDTGNPGMASGGTGDVLTGIITSLYGQGFDPFDAAVLGVYVHGLAGDIAILKHGEASLIATDLIDYLGEAFKQVTSMRS